MSAPASSAASDAAAGKLRAAVPTILMGSFFVTSLIAPAAVFNKLLFLLMLGRCALDLFLSDQGAMRETKAPFIVLLIFTYGYFLSWFNRSDSALALQFFLASSLLLLFYYVRRYDIDVDRLVKMSGVAMMLATAAYLYSKLLRDYPLAAPLAAAFEKVSLSAMAERDYFESAVLTLHIGTVPFLFAPFCLWAVEVAARPRVRTILLMLVALACMVLSGSRGLLAVSVAFAAYVLVKRFSMVGRVLALIGVIAVIYIGIDFLLSRSQVLDVQEGSNAVKIGHARSFIDALTPNSALFGNGLASFYFSSGSGVNTPHTEITPLDMARYFGIPLALLLYLTLLFPTLKMQSYLGQNAIYIIAFTLYLLLSATNPVLINSYGLLVVLWYWCKIVPQPPLTFRRVAG